MLNIKEKMETGDSFYRKPATNAPLPDVVSDYPSFELEWNFKNIFVC